MKSGRIVRAQNDFFFVASNGELVPCRLRGRFKSKTGQSIYVGDFVKFSPLPEGGGIIEELIPRKSLLLRPAVAGVNQAAVVVAAKEPDFNLLLVDRFLTLVAHSAIERAFIIVNKTDLAAKESLAEFRLYEDIGYEVVYVSALKRTGIDKLREKLMQGTTVFCGVSGAGKSSLIGTLCPNINFDIGKVSDKIKRGRHTTRTAVLVPLGDGYVVDTPGFSFVDFKNLAKEELPFLFREFAPFIGGCKFSPCSHSHEPSCAVKAAVEDGLVPKSRYESYLNILAAITAKA